MTNISAQLVSLLQGIQQAGSTAFADVRPYPTIEFDGWPAVCVVPADNMSEYQSVVQNLRTYVFDLDLYYSIEQETNGGYSTAFSVMMVLVDTVLDALDNSNDLNNSCDILRPVPSVWGMVQTSAGTALTAKITVQCAKVVNQDNG